MTDLLLRDAPFTMAGAIACGLTPRQLRRMVADGRVRVLLRGVYADARLPDCTELRARAAGLVVTPYHVVTDRSAAYLHGVDVFTYAETGGAPRVEACALRGHRETKRGQIASGSRWLIDDDIMSLAGVNVTTPIRTALDLGCRLHRRDAFAAMNGLAALHGFGVDEMVRQLHRYRGRRGVIQVRQLIPLLEPRLESLREAWVWLELHDAGLPIPEPQVWVDIDGVPTYRLDFAYRRQRVAIEYDGEENHTSQRDLQHDRERRDRLRAAGWTIIIVKNGDFTRDRLDAWIRRVRRALAETPTNLRW